MNIIKLLDKVMPENENTNSTIYVPIKTPDGISFEEMTMASYFNRYLKGKYAYWIQMRYIVSFEHMCHEGYVACEKDINELLSYDDESGKYTSSYGAPALDTQANIIIISPYIDLLETDMVNSIREFRLKNEYVTDPDITTEEVKIFRTWLAKELLGMDQTGLGEQRNALFDEAQTHVLEYYANNMYDGTIKILSTFGGNIANYTNTLSSSPCGCSRNVDLLGLYDINNPCDPIAIYKDNIKKHMVDMFKSYEFWIQWSPEFIKVFKKYIDNIIRLNLKLYNDSKDALFVECGCSFSSDQEKLMDILRRLSVSLGYIIEKDVLGHKNYINDALDDWSTQLYEVMYW